MRFCRSGKLGRPFASRATISPSNTAGSAPSPRSTPVSSGYAAVRSLPLRERSRRRVPSQIPTPRMPSHFISTHGVPPQRAAAARAIPGVAEVASIGRRSATVGGPAGSSAGRRVPATVAPPAPVAVSWLSACDALGSTRAE